MRPWFPSYLPAQVEEAHGLASCHPSLPGVFPLKFLGGVAFGGEHEATWRETLQAKGDPTPTLTQVT